MSTLAGRRGMRPKMMMPFDAQPPQRKCVRVCVCLCSREQSIWKLLTKQYETRAHKVLS